MVFLERRDQAEDRDLVALATQDFEVKSIESEALTDFGNRARLMDDESRNRGRLLVGESPVENTVEVADRRRAFHQKGTVTLRANVGLIFGGALVGNTADDFFDDVGSLPHAPHFGRVLFFKRGRIGHEPRLFHQAQNVPSCKLSFSARIFAQHRCCPQHANDVVGRFTPDRHARVVACDDAFEQFRRCKLRIDRDDAFAVDGDIADRQFAWRQPELPGDLCFLDVDEAWLTSISHEELAWIRCSPSERDLIDPARKYAEHRYNRLNATMEYNLALSKLAKATGWDSIAPEG